MAWTRWPVFSRVLVSLVDGSAIDAVLIDKRGPLLVLSDATLLTDDGEPSVMDGQVYIERTRVLFLQTAQPKGG